MLIRRHNRRPAMKERKEQVKAIVLGHDETLADEDDVLFVRPLRAARTKIRSPKIFVRWAHKFRIKLNPRYADENYDTDIYTTLDLDTILDILRSWGCKINDPNQYWYPNQVASGHIYFTNGRQLHIRVYEHEDGRYSLKAHVEWDGMVRPIMHIMYAGLDYHKGYRILKHLWDNTMQAMKEE